MKNFDWKCELLANENKCMLKSDVIFMYQTEKKEAKWKKSKENNEKKSAKKQPNRKANETCKR